VVADADPVNVTWQMFDFDRSQVVVPEALNVGAYGAAHVNPSVALSLPSVASERCDPPNTLELFN
jgi:hypothetical protein